MIMRCNIMQTPNTDMSTRNESTGNEWTTNTNKLKKQITDHIGWQQKLTAKEVEDHEGQRKSTNPIFGAINKRYLLQRCIIITRYDFGWKVILQSTHIDMWSENDKNVYQIVCSHINQQWDFNFHQKMIIWLSLL